MDVGDERAAYIALALTPGVGAARMTALLSNFQSARGALSAPFALLCMVPGINRAVATAIADASLEAGQRTLAAIEAAEAHCLLPTDPAFPAAFAEIPDPPTLLFGQGDLSLLTRPAVAVVGSRDHSAYGAEVCREVTMRAAEAGLVVVSGMARGLDAVAHTAALDAGGSTIGILGNGLGVIYPAANRILYRRVAETGLLLTEFPPGERPMVGAFPRRNRLISGLARVTVVIEAAEGSGTLITVGTALAQGRDVMAVPGNISSSTSIGTNRLIRDGAEPLLEVEDLLAHYPETVPRPRLAAADTTAGDSPGSESVKRPTPHLPPADLTPIERTLFDLLQAGSAAMDRLIEGAGRPTPEVLVALSNLELRGLVTEVTGKVALTPPGA
jgi:DNA processing protein